MSRDYSTRPQPPRGAGGGRILLAAGVVAALGVAGLVRRADATEARARAALARQNAELDALRQRVSRLAASQAGPQARAASQRWLSTVAPPALVLSELEALLPADVRLTRVGLQYGSQLELELQLLARDSAAYDRCVERLAGSPLLEELRPQRELREGELRSGVTARWRPERP